MFLVEDLITDKKNTFKTLGGTRPEENEHICPKDA